MEQAIKFAFGMLRAERANAKERKGNNSDIMVREAVVAPMDNSSPRKISTNNLAKKNLGIKSI